MKQLNKKYKSFNEKYDLTLVSAASSFYVIIAVFSFAILLIQVYTLFSSRLEDYLLTKIIEIINPVYQNLADSISPILNLSSFSIIILFNLLWAASKAINAFNRVADRIYIEINRRKEYLLRISSFMMMAIFLLLLFFEMIVIIYVNMFINTLIDNTYILRFIQIVLEVLMLFFLVSIFYIYVPPVKMNFKKVFVGSMIATISIYLITIIIAFIIDLYQKLNFYYSIFTAFALIFTWVYLLNKILIIGIIINHYYDNVGKT